jgi:Sec-independent protein translocase protein TatA
LLGTIGKFQKETSSVRARTNAVKRKEVEQKLQEKLKAQTEELDERRKREDEDLSLRKRVEAREFEKRAV